MLLRALAVIGFMAALSACGGKPCGYGIPGPYITYVSGGIPPGTFDGGADGGPSSPSDAFCSSSCPDAGPLGVACFAEPGAGPTAIQCAPIHPVCPSS
jgi:hypothetical protein